MPCLSFTSHQQSQPDGSSEERTQSRHREQSAVLSFTGADAADEGQQQRPRKLDPSSYAELILWHAKTNASNSLYQGQDWRDLVDWLNRASIPCTVSLSKPGFAWIYVLPHNPPRQTVRGSELSLPLCDTLQLSPSDGNVLIFLRGYPSPEWLKEIGARFNIDPEAFYRHLTFFHQRVALMRQAPFKLPSSQRSIFQLNLTTVGQYASARGDSLSKIRAYAAREMERYKVGMRNPTCWGLGNSIVRSFDVHNESVFSLEQLVTIYVSKESEDSPWITLVWLDSGDDLLQSPVGPWSNIGQQRSTTTFPVTMYKRSISLKHQHHRLVETEFNDVHGSKGLPQSISLLPLFYGRSLNATQMSEDPLYALHELLLFWATSETQFLNVVSSGLRSTVDLSPERFPSKMVDIQNTLVFYKDILNRHTNLISDVFEFFENRELLDWPRSQANKPQLMAQRLEYDVKYLLGKSKALQQQCESSMNTIMNQAGLQEAKRAVSESERIYRLSVLVSVFIPLSFCSSLFSMSFVNFQQTHTGIWTFFSLTIPIFAFSLTLFNWNPDKFRKYVRNPKLWSKRTQLEPVGA
ncbi:hypothetical protein AOQ84DRAFT_387904 [Glonium stellatum]|uniref:Uncharacterized protein n=1 Tax=Glonium stellatum TaxID=574774 RepID=A0A8E2F3B8_9PEZI|nr:hypothetical protein AOQ84DRAFT_387904 [Glonium stellatum]